MSELEQLEAINAELLVRLRGALYHVESEGDVTLAFMIREAITKAEGYHAMRRKEMRKKAPKTR